MKPPSIALEKITALRSRYLRVVVPENWADRNGHMNMRWYLAVFDDAGDELYLRLELTPEFHSRNKTGSFDLEHHIHFLREVMPGDTLAVYARPVSISAKRMHYVMYLVNETKNTLAAMFECVNAFGDMIGRRTAPFPPHIATNLKAWLQEDSALDWPAPVCGVMGVRGPSFAATEPANQGEINLIATAP